jgi:copper resistance protein D
MNMDGLLIGQAALAALMYVALALAVGSILFERWLSTDGSRLRNASSHPAWSRARTSIVVAAFVLVLADGGWLIYLAASMNGSGLLDGVAVLPDVLAKTQIGHAWSVAFGGAALLIIAACMYHGGRFGRAMLALGVLFCAGGTALFGHAADAGVLSVPAAAQFVHVLATAVWGGIVLSGGFIVMPALDASASRGVLIRVADRVSRTALVAFVVVLATGFVGAERMLRGTLSALRASEWGHVLMLKLALVLLAVVLGALNRTSVLPRLRRTASTTDAHTFNNLLHLEAVLIAAVFVLASVLGQLPPP